ALPSFSGVLGCDELGRPPRRRQVTADLDDALDPGGLRGVEEVVEARELFVLVGPNLGLRLSGTQRQPHTGADVEVGAGVDGGESKRFGHRWVGSGGARGHYSDSSTNFGNTGSGFGSGVPGSSGNATAANDRGSTSASASPPAAASATFGARPAEA